MSLLFCKLLQQQKLLLLQLLLLLLYKKFTLTIIYKVTIQLYNTDDHVKEGENEKLSSLIHVVRNHHVGRLWIVDQTLIE